MIFKNVEIGVGQKYKKKILQKNIAQGQTHINLAKLAFLKTFFSTQ